MRTSKSYSKINSFVKKNESRFPYRFIEDEIGNPIPIVVLTAFFRNDKDKELYYTYIKEGIPVIGMTAYKTFPMPIYDEAEDKFHLTDDFNYLNIKTWLYCMNDYERYGLNNTYHNLLNISESDFYNIDETSEVAKKYDFIYICNKDSDSCPMNGWNAINRNYALALKCFPIMVNKYKLKGLCVGRIHCDLSQYGNNIETTDFIKWEDLQLKMKESKFLFMPNIYDASPRVIGECMTKGLPVLMNRAIVCGTKYVNELTGELFTDENDIEYNLIKMIQKLDSNEYKCREWWRNTYGIDNSAKKLATFIGEIYPHLNHHKFMKLII